MNRDVAYRVLSDELAIFQQSSSWAGLYQRAGSIETKRLIAPDGTPILLELKFIDDDGDIRIEGTLDMASHWRLERLEESILIRRRDVVGESIRQVAEKNAELYRRLADS